MVVKTFLITKEEQRLMVWDNRVLSRQRGPERKGVTGGCNYINRSIVIFTVHHMFLGR